MYTFLLASLPALKPDMAPPLTLDELDGAAHDALLPDADCVKLVSFDGTIDWEKRDPALPRVYREYLEFERFLRLRIARKRADRRSAAAELPAAELFDAETALRVDQAANLPPIEREKSIDALRWQKIDEIAQSHHFDFDALCAYRLRLMLLVSHSRRDAARGRASFGALLDEKAAMA